MRVDSRWGYFPARKESGSKLALLTPRQLGFVVGNLEGKSDRRAALDARYAPSTAENTKQKIMSRPEVREAFNELLNDHLPPEKLVRRMVEGLDATQVKFFSREGDGLESVVLPDHRVRRRNFGDFFTPAEQLQSATKEIRL